MSKNSNLFKVDPKNSMKFKVIGRVFPSIKLNQLKTKIEDNGGILVKSDSDGNDGCILLADKSYKITKETAHLEIFKLKYVRECISEKKILKLADYKIKTELQQSPKTKESQVEPSQLWPNRMYVKSAEEVVQELKNKHNFDKINSK